MNPDDAQSSFEHSFPPHAEADEWIGAKQTELSDLAGGCLAIGGSAFVTTCLLVMNGALVMALLTTASAARVPFSDNPKAGQFILFSVPILLTVIQWKLIDTLRRILRRRTPDTEH